MQNMKKYLFFLLLIFFCSCGGNQDNVDVTKEDTIPDSFVDTVLLVLGDYKVDYDSYPSETPKSVFLIDELYGKYGSKIFQLDELYGKYCSIGFPRPLTAALNAFDELPEFTDSTIAEIEQFYKNLDESEVTGDMVLAANVRRNLAFYKTIREYSELNKDKMTSDLTYNLILYDLIAAEYVEWNLLADQVGRLGVDIVYLTYFEGSMIEPVSSNLIASIQEIGYYNANVLKCRLIRDSCHLKEGIPEKIAAEALCKTIDFNLEQLNHPEYYEGDTRREYKLSLKNAKSNRKGLEEKIEKWLTLRYVIGGMVDGDDYGPYVGSTGVLLINLAAAINR